MPSTKTGRVRSRLDLMKDLGTADLKATLVDQFAKAGPPGNKELNMFLDKCESAEDVESALELVQKFRVERISNSVFANFQDGTSIKLFHACSRAGLPEKAFEAFARSTVLGLQVSDKLIQLLAEHECSLTEDQVDAVMSAYSSARVAKVSQGAGTASVVLLTLLKGNEAARAVAFAERLLSSGDKPLAGVWPALAAGAKEAGLEAQVQALQQ